MFLIDYDPVGFNYFNNDLAKTVASFHVLDWPEYLCETEGNFKVVCEQFILGYRKYMPLSTKDVKEINLFSKLRMFQSCFYTKSVDDQTRVKMHDDVLGARKLLPEVA